MRLSYLSIFILLLFLIGCAGLGTDIKVKRKWKNKNLLENDSGFIYTSIYLRNEKRQTLSRYNLKTYKWDTLGAWFPNIDANIWDISKNIFVGFIETHFNKCEIGVVDLNKKTIINKFVVRNSKEIRISPDNIKIALFELVGWNTDFHYNDSTLYYPYSSLYRIVIIELLTGKIIYKSKDIALDKGFAWAKDSKKLVIISTDSIGSLQPIKYNPYKMETEPYKKQAVFFNKEEFLKEQKLKKLEPTKLCLLDIGTGERTVLTEGKYPTLIQNTGNIAFCRNDSLYALSLEDFKILNYSLKVTPYWYDISPSGNTVLSAIEHFLFYDVNCYLVAIQTNDVENPYIISKYVYHHFVWRE